MFFSRLYVSVVSLFNKSYRDVSNSKLALRVRARFGPDVQSAKQAILDDSKPIGGYCPVCARAFAKNEPVWLIVQIPSTDDQVVGALTQKHCNFYVDGDLLRVAVCVKPRPDEDNPGRMKYCREKTHRSDIYAILDEKGRPSKKSLMLGHQQMSPYMRVLLEGVVPIVMSQRKI